MIQRLNYDRPIEESLIRLGELLQGSYGVSKRSLSLLLLQGDPEVSNLVREREKPRYQAIADTVRLAQQAYGQPLAYVIAKDRQKAAGYIASNTISTVSDTGRSFSEQLSQAMTNPVTGIPFLFLVLLALYYFVGVIGAGTVVGFLEDDVFGKHVVPWITDLIDVIPWQAVQDLFVGEYGLVTLGLTYAIALILPIVGIFFIAFSVIEDTGYLPRLAMLIDRVFKKIGLSGRAVIPMVLGFGCDTMATVVTRTQETRRERVITTLLLALAIPCSAQLGVIFGILSESVGALLVWSGVVFGVFLLVGYLASRIIPGDRPSFFMEMPPLRTPRIGNILSKTYTRMQWYFLEVLPFFLLASFLLWLGDLTGVFQVIIDGLEPLMRLMDLPAEAASVFIYGFFRRDFGAVGLYDMYDSGIINGVSLVVAAVTLTLFVPCIAQFMIMFKERGGKTALIMGMFIFPFAFAVGLLLNLILGAMEVSL